MEKEGPWVLHGFYSQTLGNTNRSRFISTSIPRIDRLMGRPWPIGLPPHRLRRGACGKNRWNDSYRCLFFGIRLEVPNFFELKSFLLKKSFWIKWFERNQRCPFRWYVFFSKKKTRSHLTANINMTMENRPGMETYVLFFSSSLNFVACEDVILWSPSTFVWMFAKKINAFSMG